MNASLATQRLEALYAREKVGVVGFACPHQSECCSAAAPRPLRHGAEAHVGSCYGDSLRVVVVSLDTGGGSETLTERRHVVETNEKPKSHMRGTITALRALLGSEVPQEQLLRLFAMINAAKCSASDGKHEMVPARLYELCRPFGWEEVKLLEPEVIVAQGANARAVIPNGRRLTDAELGAAFSSLPADPPLSEWLGRLAQRYIRLVDLGMRRSVCIDGPHPSARGGQWKNFEVAALQPVAWVARRVVACGLTQCSCGLQKPSA